MPFRYPSNKYACARCWKQNNDMAFFDLYFPDNRPYEHTEGNTVVKEHHIRVLVCYDHAEEVLRYLTGRERKLKRLYPKDLKQRELFEVGTFK